ncbi:MAG: hypothetical protein KC425_19945, partial [Anaerolineales bacterium]|nr:hypothetical protein [Anaerolineales bacterium]
MILTLQPDFLPLATAELRRAAPGARLTAELAPGVWRVALPDGFFPLAERWRRQPPIFVRHICPVQVELSLAETTVAALPAPILAAVADLVDPDLSFSVQTRAFDTAVKPFDVNRPLADALHAATGAPLDVRQPRQILSVVIHGETLFAGFSLAAHNLSDWAGGARRFAREKGQISRAEFKLLEALELFAVPLPPYGVALDLGAAPGGWTRVLQQREQ